MKQGGGRVKGAAFELRISKELVLAAKRAGMTRKDCYRTPLSGGHPFGDRGDLVISPAFAELFPFCVEAKHYSNWSPGVMFEPRAQELSWIDQVVKATQQCQNLRHPLLVVSGNRTGAYAVAPWNVLRRYDAQLVYYGGYLFTWVHGSKYGGWVVVPWGSILQAVKLKAKTYNKDKKG